MTTPLIEAIAASLEPLVNDGMAEPFKSAWLTDLAQAALTAITEAGYVCIALEPSFESKEERAAIAKRITDDECEYWHTECGNRPECQKYRMISAAQGDGA